MASFQKILIVKTSSLGDIIHMLPAITDAYTRRPELHIDWVVEEGFAEVPYWHPAVQEVFPIAIRRWRKKLFSRQFFQEIKQAKQCIGMHNYDAIIDAQGLLKSALISRWAKGKRYGFDASSAREPLASLFYQRHTVVERNRHAIKRNRLLLANILGYSISNLPLDYGVQLPEIEADIPFHSEPYIVVLHGTSRSNKEWPVSHWHQLADTLLSHPVHLLFPWGNEAERIRAQQLAQQHSNVRMLPKSNLTVLAHIIANSIGVIGMDTGLMHVAAALNKVGLALYPATKPALTGVVRGESAHGELHILSGAETQNVHQVIQQLLRILTLRTPQT